MALNQTPFRERPEFLRGRTGEELVAAQLQKQGWYIIPSYDYTGEDRDKAPRLQGAKDALVIPDLDVSKNGTRRWAEVKTKGRCTYTRTTASFDHGIDKRHFDSYRQVQAIGGTEVWLFIVEECSGCVLCARLDDLLLVVRLSKEALYGKGGMVYFPRSAFLGNRPSLCENCQLPY